MNCFEQDFVVMTSCEDSFVQSLSFDISFICLFPVRLLVQLFHEEYIPGLKKSRSTIIEHKNFVAHEKASGNCVMLGYNLKNKVDIIHLHVVCISILLHRYVFILLQLIRVCWCLTTEDTTGLCCHFINWDARLFSLSDC